MPALVLLLALALDLLLGDPPNRYHPVALMGNFIRGMTRLAPQEGPTRRFIHGTVLVLSGVALFSLPLAWALAWIWRLNPLAYLLLAALLLKVPFAYTGLVKAAYQVKAALERGNLPEARRLNRECLAIRRQIDDRWGIATSLNNLGYMAYLADEYAEAVQRRSSL